MHTHVTAYAKPKSRVKAGLLEGDLQWALVGGNILMHLGEVRRNLSHPSDVNPLT